MIIPRRALAAGIRTKISAHSFRATGITTYLQNGGKLEIDAADGRARFVANDWTLRPPERFCGAR